MTSSARRRACLGLAAVASSLLVLGCVQAYGPNPYRVSCLQGCARQKDQCVLEATSASAVARCDDASRACGEACPP